MTTKQSQFVIFLGAYFRPPFPLFSVPLCYTEKELTQVGAQ
jgi:hypothetical protein